MPDHSPLLQSLSDAVVAMDTDATVTLAHQVIADHVDAYQAIDQGLSAGMERAGKLFEQEDYFIPELLLCSDAMYAGLDVLKPHLTAVSEKKGTIVIGVIEGDTHDIGKNLVKMMCETTGFEIIDLGRDIPPQQFVDQAKAHNAQLIAISTLMTTTMDGIAEVIRILNRENIRDRFKVLVGGGPISSAFAQKIGADGYAPNATAAAQLARELLTTTANI